MTRHKHADMIIAKAENIELIRLTKFDDNLGCEWVAQSDIVQRSTKFNEQSDYFLCLPKHKKECLHWLNGGEVQIQTSKGWLDIDAHAGDAHWHRFSLFMVDDAQIRIKPSKEKLYIAVKTDKYEHLGGCRKVRICSHAFVSKCDAENYLDLSDSQLVEIEVEV